MEKTREEDWLERNKHRVMINPKTGLIRWESDSDKRKTEFVGSLNGDGYVIVEPDRISAHRIIWTYVNGAIPEGHQIHHKDKNPSNNSISNLKAISREAHAALHNKPEKMRLFKNKDMNPLHAVLTEEDAVTIRRWHSEGIPSLRLSRMFNVTEKAVNEVVNHQTWKNAGGGEYDTLLAELGITKIDAMCMGRLVREGVRPSVLSKMFDISVANVNKVSMAV